VDDGHACRDALSWSSPDVGRGRRRAGITCFIVPADAPGMKIEEYMWTFNMPTDHPRVSFTNVWVPERRGYWGQVDRGLGLAQSFVHQNRIRQAASALGAAVSASRRA
jgi:acyl-CoA dehydrogenase